MSTDHVPKPPVPSRVRNLLGRYRAVRLEYAVDELSLGDQRAVGELIDACSFVDEIYWRQRSQIGVSLRDYLATHGDESSSSLRRLLAINFGPWDTLNDDRPFWGDAVRPPGGNLYPADLTREEFDSYIDSHPEERHLLQSPTTLVRRQGKRLSAVPYQEAYRELLVAIAERLKAAGDLVSEERFASFLRSRAKGLLSGELSESERQWVELGSGPVDITIGPYEVYDDTLLGLKTSYEAMVLIRHRLSDKLAEFTGVFPELEGEIPGMLSSDPMSRSVSIGVYDVAHAAGMTNMGAKAIAATLPNDERIRTEVGSRLLLFNNVAAAKFHAFLRPIAERVLVPTNADLVNEQAFVLHTILHETAHAFSPGFVLQDGRATTKTINQALRERFSTIEESRADLVGIVYLNRLIRSGMVSTTTGDAANATFVANCVRALRFGVGSDYSRAAALALTHLQEAGAVVLERGLLAITGRTFERAIRDLAVKVQTIATTGDYPGAGQLMERLASMPRGVPPLLEKLEDIPIDIEFAFTTAPRFESKAPYTVG